MRELFVFCDGTNNTLRGGAEETNVVSLYRHLEATLPPTPDVERFFYYDPGVGTPDTLPPAGPVEWLQGALNRAAGLASGKGVYENIASAYLFLMRSWTGPDDRIFIFGFSRGAFTARCVAGMVNLFGIIRQEHEVLIPTLVHTYFSAPDEGGTRLTRITKALHRMWSKSRKAAAEAGAPAKDRTPVRRYAVADEIGRLFATEDGRQAWVHWVGVWDTVESVGMPGPLSRSNPASANIGDKRYRNVRHALSLDEHRYAFLPRLYEEPEDISDQERTFKQRWFPGVHCDVGGSYTERTCGLSDAALDWMCNELAEHLPVAPMTFAPRRYRRHDALWDTPFWALAGMVVRRVDNVKVEVPRELNGNQHVFMKMVAAPALDNPVGARITSEWQLRRAGWPLAVAAVVALVGLSGSGYALLSEAQLAPYQLAPPQLWANPDTWNDFFDFWALAWGTAADFAVDQLWLLRGGGLPYEGHLLWQQAGQPGWSAFWDLVYVAGWSYFLARISSRAFAWMAGVRNVASPSPRWLLLGMAPLALVAMCVAVDGFIWAALAAHGIGIDWLGKVFTCLVAAAWIAKLAASVGCLPLLVLRYWIAFRPSGTFDPVQADANARDPERDQASRRRPGTMRGTWLAKHPRYRSSDLYGLTGTAIAAAAVWGIARVGICWGNFGAPGAVLCKSHYLVVALGLFGLFSLVMMFVDLARSHGEQSTSSRYPRLRAVGAGFGALSRIQSIHVLASTVLAVAFFALAALFAWVSVWRF